MTLKPQMLSRIVHPIVLAEPVHLSPALDVYMLQASSIAGRSVSSLFALSAFDCGFLQNGEKA